MHIGLLECDNVVGRFAHLAGGYREMFAALLGEHIPGLRFSYFDVVGKALPPAVDACDAYAATGSQYSVYDPHDWIEPLSQFLQDLHSAEKPFVGICFGHQMLAQALGGRVARSPLGWGVGIHDMTITRQEPWMRPRQARCRLHYMHADQVERLPLDAVVLAQSEHCEVAMFRVGETMLGIEGHPEFNNAFSEALIRARAERIGAERVRAALDSLAQPTDRQTIGRWVAQFLRRRT